MANKINDATAADREEAVNDAKLEVYHAASGLGLPVVGQGDVDEFFGWIAEQRAYCKSLSDVDLEHWKNNEPTSVSFTDWKQSR